MVVNVILDILTRDYNNVNNISVMILVKHVTEPPTTHVIHVSIHSLELKAEVSHQLVIASLIILI